jgi:hypothetical protein
VNDLVEAEEGGEEGGVLANAGGVFPKEYDDSARMGMYVPMRCLGEYLRLTRVREVRKRKGFGQVSVKQLACPCLPPSSQRGSCRPRP